MWFIIPSPPTNLRTKMTDPHSSTLTFDEIIEILEEELERSEVDDDEYKELKFDNLE